MKKQSIRSQLVAKRTYNRPLDEHGTVFETWEQTVNRVIEHQRWLWERAKGHNTNEDLVELTPAEEHELEELRELLLNYDVAVSGRTFWLGGTAISKEYEATQFNCAGVVNATVHDIVDSFHLLLLGCGVGFDQFVGVLNGFTNPVDIEIIKSTRKDRGVDNNKERFYHRDGKLVWHLTVGDSGIAWAKAAGKLLAMKKPVDVVILDFSEIRPGGKPLKGFGWISSGDVQISESFYEICKILSEKHGQLLSRINILDIMNWFGMALSSRRAAEIALCPVDDPEAEEFISAKKDYWKVGKKQRGMSNNTVMFHRRPSKSELRGIFHQMMEAGGSEPGFLNVQAAKKRAPWFATVNPCCEILLGNKSFCVSGDTKLITKSGITTIRDAVGQEIEIWNGNEWAPVTPFKTGDADELIRVSFNDGSYLDVTENHRFFVSNIADGSYKEVLAKDLNVGLYTEPVNMRYDDIGEQVDDAYAIGEMLTYNDADVAMRIVTSAFSWNRSSICNFILGIVDDFRSSAEYTIGAPYGFSGWVGLGDEFIRLVQLLLTKIGVMSRISYIQSYYLEIIDAEKLTSLTTPTDVKFNQMIIGVCALPGTYESFCFTEPKTGKGVFGNTLTGQCNLATIPLNKYNGDYERLKYNSRLIARANYRQTCVDLRDGILQDTWHELNEFLRLTGMSACGVVGWEYHQDANKVKEYADHIREAVHEMADELGLPRSKAITTIKPEGCCFYDTKIKTSLGVVTLDELFDKLNAPEFDSWYDVADKGVFVYDMNNEPQLITKLFNNGVSETLKVTFEDGSFVECTPNHKFYIDGNWIRADELVAGLDVTNY